MYVLKVGKQPAELQKKMSHGSQKKREEARAIERSTEGCCYDEDGELPELLTIVPDQWGLVKTHTYSHMTPYSRKISI